jgi:putative sterol carrier protein
VNSGVEMLMKLGAFTTRMARGRMVDERARAEMRGLSGVMNLEFSGSDGGGWHVEFGDGKVLLARGLIDDARATVRVTPQDYLALLAGDLSYSVARMTGRVRVAGDGHFGMIFGAFVENIRTAQMVKGVRGAIARAVVARALRKGGYAKKRAAPGAALEERRDR